MSIQAVTPQIPFYKTVIGFRIVWLAIAILAIQALLPLGTNSLVVIGFGAIGIIGASYLAHTRITNLGVTLGLLSAVIACSAATWLLQQVFGLFGITTFAIDRLSLHIGTCLMCMVAAGVATCSGS
jgi:hypothetical protein